MLAAALDEFFGLSEASRAGRGGEQFTHRTMAGHQHAHAARVAQDCRAGFDQM
jgi:hypothetical protein